MWELDYKESWAPKNWCFFFRTEAFELWCWRRLLRVPWTARRSSQSILKEISPEYSLEGLMLKLKLQYFGHLMWRGLIGKDPDAGKDWGQEEKGTTEDEMVGWHHRLNGHGFRWTPGISDGQGEAWHVVVHGLTRSQTRLSDWTDDYSNLGFYLNTGISISLSHHHDVTMFMASWTSPVLSGFPHLSFQQSDTLGSLVTAFAFALQLMAEYLSLYNSYPSEAPAKKPSVRTIFTPFTLLCLLHTETTHDSNFQEELAGVPRVRETCYVAKPC